MVNELAPRRDAALLQNNENRNREVGRRFPVLHDSLEIHHSLERGLNSFPECIRINVATAVSRVIDVGSDPGRQRRIVESSLKSLKEIYLLGGEEALSEWCGLIQNCGCYLGSAETEMILTGVVSWLRSNVDPSGRDAKRYMKAALINAAKTLCDSRMLQLLDRDFLPDFPEDGDYDTRAAIATSLSVIGGRWGIEKAAKIAVALGRVELENPEFILAGCEIGSTSARDLELLAESLERDGALLWAFPGVNKGTLESLMRTPGRIINSILRREGLPEDLSLTLAERRERIGWLSAGLDLKALGNPDKGVRVAAIDRLISLATDQNLSALLRNAAMKGLGKVAKDIPIEGFLRLGSVLRHGAENKKLRKGAALVLLSQSSPGFLNKVREKLGDESIVEIGLTIIPYVKRKDLIAKGFANGLAETPRHQLGNVAKSLRDPEVVGALDQFEEVVAAAIAQNFVKIAEKDAWLGCAPVAKRLQYPYVRDTICQFEGRIGGAVGVILTHIIHRHLFSEHAIRHVTNSMQNPEVVETLNRFEANTAVGIAYVLTDMAYHKWESVVVEGARTLREYDDDIALTIAKKLMYISREGKAAIDWAAERAKNLKDNAAVEVRDELAIHVYPFDYSQIENVARKYAGGPASEIVNELLNTVAMNKDVGQIAKGMRHPDVVDAINRFEGKAASDIAGTFMDIADQKGDSAVIETARTLKEYENRIAMAILERLADIYLAKEDTRVTHYLELTYGFGAHDLERVAKKMGLPEVIDTITQFGNEVGTKIAYSLTGINWTSEDGAVIEIARTIREYKDEAAVAIASKLANQGHSVSGAASNLRSPEVVEVINRFEGEAAAKAAFALADIASSRHTLIETVNSLRRIGYSQNAGNIDELIESINKRYP